MQLILTHHRSFSIFRSNTYSYGKLIFTKAANKTRTNPTASAGSTDIIDGVVTIKIDAASNGVDNGVVRNLVTAKIKQIFGDAIQLADHVMYCLPPGTLGDWIAYAYMYSWLSVYNNEWCNSLSGQMRKCREACYWCMWTCFDFWKEN